MITFFNIVFHLLKLEFENAHEVIINHAIITIRNENTIIADINIFISHCINSGNAVILVTAVVSHLWESVFSSMQSQINGTTVFNFIQQHLLLESHIHFVCYSLAIVQLSHSLQLVSIASQPVRYFCHWHINVQQPSVPVLYHGSKTQPIIGCSHVCPAGGVVPCPHCSHVQKLTVYENAIIHKRKLNIYFKFFIFIKNILIIKSILTYRLSLHLQ